MKLSGTVEVSNRVLPSLNVKNKRPERSFLSLGTLPGKEGALFILHQTLKNGVGVKYKVQSNVQTIFTKFINDGKATIRFVNPPHDLIIKSEPEKLKHFLKILKLSLEGKQVNLSLLIGAPTKVTPKPKTKLIVSSKRELPLLSGYPRSLEYLQMNNVELKKIDGSLLRLQFLRVLNLSDNEIEFVPPNLDLLPNLKEIHLARNNLGVGNDWRWMACKLIQEQILHLDLSSNKIHRLPCFINRFKVLRHLNLSNNNLNRLPNGLGLLSSLRVLEIGQNFIEYLPSSFRFLNLTSIDMSGNGAEVPSFCSQFGRTLEPSLLDRAASVVLSQRYPFDNRSIPWTLVEYLESANYCVCGSPVLPPSVVAAVPFDLRKISTSVTFVQNMNPLIGITFCSSKCRSMAYLTSKLIFNVTHP